MAPAEINNDGRDIVARDVEEIPPIELYDNPEVLVRFVPDSGNGGVQDCARSPIFVWLRREPLFDPLVLL